MSLTEKVRAVEALFADLDQAISTFQSWSTLSCKAGCGKCCFKPDIEATVLEFLPFAHYLYETEQGAAWIEKCATADSPVCLILNPGQSGAGLCSAYAHRGLICRLFGYSARLNKYGSRELVTCSIIKTEQESAFGLAQQKIADGGVVPVMTNYYMRMQAIDPDLARDFYPINRAIQKALETVFHYYAYRN